MSTRTTFSRRAGLAAAGLVLSALLSAGCGGTGQVSGKVYFNDRPVGGGTVTFTSADGKGSKSTSIGPDGSYTIAAMPSGLAKIAVETESARPTTPVGPPAPGQAPGAGRRGLPMPPEDKVPPAFDRKMYEVKKAAGSTYTKIPDAYADPEKSGLTYAVKKGSQDFDIRLK
jgi:hypothetical protein